MLWRQGIVPYIGAFDVKPPGFFVALAFSQFIFGAGPFALHALGTVCDALTATLLLRLGCRRATGVGVFAAMLFPLLSQTVARNDCYDVLAATTTLAMFIAMSNLPLARKAMLSGLCIGAACVVKQTAVFEGAALLAILAIEIAKGQRLRALLIYGASAAVAPLACIGYFAAHGALDVMLNDIVSVAMNRPSAASDNISILGGLPRFLENARGIGPLLVIAVVTAVARRGVGDTRNLGLWLAFAAAGVLAQHALLPCYLTPLLAPSLLLVGDGVAAVWPKDSTLSRFGGFGALGLAILELVIGVQLGQAREPIDLRSIDDMVAAIHDAGPRPEDRLYLVNATPHAIWIYPAAGVRPATRYLIPNESLCDFPSVGPTRIAEAMATRPRFVVVSAFSFRYGCEVPGAHDIADTALRRDYRRIARVGAGVESYDLYEIAN